MFNYLSSIFNYLSSQIEIVNHNLEKEMSSKLCRESEYINKTNKSTLVLDRPSISSFQELHPPDIGGLQFAALCR